MTIFGITCDRLTVIAILLVGIGAMAVMSHSRPRPRTANFAEHAGADMPYTEKAYLAETASAMEEMMRNMHGRPTGDIDRDFVQEMIPHHQGAVDMAKALMKAGHDERLKRLAQEIVITQEDEITVMRLLIADQQAAQPSRQRGGLGGASP
jgi:uncharacterized protein (DUF305 family)